MTIQTLPNVAHETRHEDVQPSAHLLELCRAYLEIVDNQDETRQGAERTAAHNALIAEMLNAGIIDAPNRVQVRWLARYFVQTDYLQRAHTAPHTFVMFVRKGAAHPRLEFVPPYQEDEEKSALAFYVPVRVTIEPLLEDTDNDAPAYTVGME